MRDGAVTNGAAKRRRLAQRRKALGLTQEGLAEQLGVERSTVVRWERGETSRCRGSGPSWPRRWGSRLSRSRSCWPPARRRSRQGPTAAPRQLPAAVADFTGRAAELQALTAMLDAGRRRQRRGRW